LSRRENTAVYCPKLRPVEVVLARASGNPIYLVRDACRMTDGAVTVSEDILYILRFFDGRHSTLDIRAEYMRRFGGFLYEEHLEELVQKLDSSLLLESERFDKYMKTVTDEFASSEVRGPSQAGSAYPESPEELSAMFDGFFAHPDGPGPLSSGAEAGKPPRGLVLPHIDMRAGGPCMAWGYRELDREERPDLFVILGTGHTNPQNNFAITRKDFLTPLGRAATQRSFVDSVLERCGTDFTAGEFAHKSEHSVEFQVVFLQYLYGKLSEEGRGPSIVPVLCSFGYGDVGSGAFSEAAERVVDFVAALRHAVESSGQRVCFVASADLAHLGPRYGDARGISDAEMGTYKSRDLQMLGAVERGDAGEFAAFVAGERDARRVCGFSSIYTLLRSIEPTRGRLLKYSYAPVDNAGSVVSFASMALE
jgi:AmmeMemoRadiSam system protein B